MYIKHRIRYILAVLIGLVLFASTPLYLAQAQATNIVIDGNARFTVLSPTLIRMEYAADGVFDNGTTFNVVNRNFPIPSYTTQVVSGWREIRTSSLFLRYQQNSGPFGPSNVTVQLTVSGQSVTAQPFALCTFGRLCEAEDATLDGNASVAADHANYTGSGFVAGYNAAGARTTWTVQGAAAGNATLTARYANSTGGDGQNITRTLSLYVNGTKTQISLPTTSNWDTWANYQRTVSLNAGSNTIVLACDTGDSCNVNLDSLSLTTVGGALPGPTTSTNLGGWRRGLDQINGPVPLLDGLLDRRGWYLLNDSKTVLWTAGGSPQQRSAHGGAYQDGYFFGYAHDYKLGLREFAQLTGSAPMLPRWAFGNWFSRYYAYTAGNYQSLLNTFRTEQVPLDVLVVDTDWKSPSQWDGWNWNTSYFPDPAGFMNWARQNGLKVSLNIHPGIDTNDPKFNTANTTAGGLIGTGTTRYFDWANANHTRAYFDLHTPFNNQGVRVWWLDWCCDASRVSTPNLTQDSWINYLYAKNGTDQGLRGFAFSRMGGAYAGYANTGPSASGPWAEHRYTVQFTGDTYATWPLLQFAAKVTIREGNIGLPYVSHDIGSFHGAQMADDYYMRWIQLGAFQPIFRVHSDHGQRLPWEYPNVKAQAVKFWRLREALVPYTYSLAREANQTGLPMARGLYLYYPENNEAYTYDTEYLYGANMLVAPIVTAGSNASVSVWFPPGTWTNYFTGQTYTGPSVQNVSATYDTYPVFVKAGGIIPLQPYMDYVGQRAVDPLTLRVFTGTDGSFSLYEDEGEGLAYQSGASRTTNLTFTNTSRTLQIGAGQGTYSGAPAQRAYDLEFNGVTAAVTGVTVNGASLSQIPAGSGEGWWYGSSRLNVHLNTRSTTSALTITYTTGTTPVGVIFYQDINYGGTASGVKLQGDYASLPADVPDNWMSSLRVPAGWTVEAYANANFGGAVCTFTADTSWVGSACNDVMSSFRIRTSAVGVIFYQNINYGGVASGMKAKGDYASLPADVPNDWMSSLRVPAGWIVDAYADANFGGAVCTFTADTAWVGSACNDRMSSFRIR